MKKTLEELLDGSNGTQRSGENTKASENIKSNANHGEYKSCSEFFGSEYYREQVGIVLTEAFEEWHSQLKPKVDAKGDVLNPETGLPEIDWDAHKSFKL